MASLVSKRIHLTAKNLYKLQISINGISLIRTKIKLMSAFERVSGIKTLGFSVISLFIMSYPLLYKVSHYNFIIQISIKILKYISFNITDDSSLHSIFHINP